VTISPKKKKLQRQREKRALRYIHPRIL